MNMHVGAKMSMIVPPSSSKPVPVEFAFSEIWVRPFDKMVTFPDEPINCQKSKLRQGDSESISLNCMKTLEPEKPLRYVPILSRIVLSIKL